STSSSTSPTPPACRRCWAGWARSRPISAAAAAAAARARARARGHAQEAADDEARAPGRHDAHGDHDRDRDPDAHDDHGVVDDDDGAKTNWVRRESRRLSNKPWKQEPADVDILIHDVEQVEIKFWSWQNQEWQDHWDTTQGDAEKNRLPTRVKITVKYKNS